MSLSSLLASARISANLNVILFGPMRLSWFPDHISLTTSFFYTPILHLLSLDRPRSDPLLYFFLLFCELCEFCARLCLLLLVSTVCFLILDLYLRFEVAIFAEYSKTRGLTSKLGLEGRPGRWCSSASSCLK